MTDARTTLFRVPVIETDVRTRLVRAPVIETDARTTLFRVPVIETDVRTTLVRVPVIETDVRTTLVRAPVIEADARRTLVRAPVIEADARRTLVRVPVIEADARTTLVRAPVIEADARTTLVRAPVVVKDARTTLDRAPVIETDLRTSEMDGPVLTTCLPVGVARSSAIVTDEGKGDASGLPRPVSDPVADAAAPVPTRIAHFRITGPLGQGGMGVVYRAEDETLRRTVALKLLPDATGDDERRQRFLREARSAAAITHPNVATIYQVGEAEGRVYIAMELVEGENLRERMGRGRIDVATARDLAGQIARGLAAAHDKGIVHRDLKPENVMITPSGSVKLLDFGLAKAGVDSPASGRSPSALAETVTLVTTGEGRLLGTPEYMSPEQSLGEPLDVRSDVFSLGIVLYEMLAGARPFQGATVRAVLVAIARDAPAPLRQQAPEVDEATEAIVMRCLAKAPGERFAGAGEIVAALSALAPPTMTTASGIAASPITRGEAAARRRVPWPAAVGLSLVVVAGVGAWRLAPRPAAPAVVPVASASAPAASGEPIARTANPEARRLFDEAMQSFHDGTGHVLALLRDATKADPGFAGAYLRLWAVASNGWTVEEDGSDAADEYYRRLVPLRASMSPRERALLDALSAQSVDSRAAKLDAYLATFPDDDLAWVARVMDVASLDRALAARPTLAPLLELEAMTLASGPRRDEALAVLARCLEASPDSTVCLAQRAAVLDRRADCAGAEKDLRRWLVLQPDSRAARPLLAGVLAAQGAPVVAVREALGEHPTPATGDGNVIFEALVPLFEGDFREVQRLAKEQSAKIPSDAPEAEHFTPAATLVSAYTETGDRAGAGRVAADYVARRVAWKDPRPERVGLMLGAAVRGGAMEPAEANRRAEEAFQALVAHQWLPADAWAAVHAYGSETPAEARAAVTRLDALDAGAPDTYRGALSRTYFLAGRGGEARPFLQTATTGCSQSLLVTVNWVRSHLYLGELDEQAGDKASACAHFAKVLERWGHARPRSVTADEARAHAAKLGCGL